MNLTKIGHWAFILGIIIAILAGFSEIYYLPTILFVLGLIVGFLNITEKESTPFLVAVIALLLTGTAGFQLGFITPLFSRILSNFLAFISATALLVALKQVVTKGKAE